MTQEEEIADLKKQLSEVVERLNGVLEQLSKAQERESQYREQLAAAQKRIEELEKQKMPPPAFVKANVKKGQDGEKPPRKKRDPRHNHGRKREGPTQFVEHRIRYCPVCTSALGECGTSATSDGAAAPASSRSVGASCSFPLLFGSKPLHLTREGVCQQCYQDG